MHERDFRYELDARVALFSLYAFVIVVVSVAFAAIAAVAGIFFFILWVIIKNDVY